MSQRIFVPFVQHNDGALSQRTSTEQSLRDTHPLALHVMADNGGDIVVVHGRSLRGSATKHGFSE